LSPEREQAELLLRKAREDQAVVVALLADHGIADAMLGFHAQQAVEKALKSVLAVRGDDFPWTHDRQLLLRRLDLAGVDVPPEVHAARRLTPWAVEFRYGEVIEDELDRESTKELVAAVIAWAADQATEA
jgi:HEPN domain-containing protein